MHLSRLSAYFGDLSNYMSELPVWKMVMYWLILDDLKSKDLLFSAKAAFSDLSTTGERQLRKRPQASQSASAPAKTAKKTAKTPKVCMLSVHSILWCK